MSEPATYRKTAKGEEEIAKRTYRLPARERSVLVMVDGKIPTGDLTKRAAMLGDAAALIGNLLAGGFIEGVGAAVEAQPAAAVFDASHQEAARYAAHFLLDALGPGSDMIGARVEACRDPGELVPLLEKCREAIQVGAGKRKAEEFWAGVKARLAGLP